MFRFCNVFNLNKVLDSFGRVPSGIYSGNSIWSGEYSQCIDIKEDEWNSKYCYLKNDRLKLFNNKYETIFVTY